MTADLEAHVQSAAEQPGSVPQSHLRPRGGSRVGRAGLWLLRYPIAVATAVLFVVLSLSSPAFLSRSNLVNILQANAEIGIVACAGTLVIICGALDISVGAIYAFGAVVAAKITVGTGNAMTGALAAVLVGAALGMINGLLVTAGRLNSFIATLASAILFQSAAQAMTGGALLTPPEPGYTALGRGSLLGYNYSVWLWLACALLAGAALSRTRFGRGLLVAGLNSEAARLSGTSVGRVRCATLVLSGTAAALAGVLVASRTGQVDASVGGTPYVLRVIAAIAVGGTSLRGGQGGVGRTVLGVLFLGEVVNGLNLWDVDPTYQQMVTGGLILVAVGAASATDHIGRRYGD